MSRAQPRVGLLVMGHVDPASQHIAGDYPDLFAALLEPVGLALECFAVDEGHLPASVRDCDAWITSPSRSSVYEPLPWIADATAFVRDGVEAGVPFVGICFGHQLLAQAFGGRVERATGGWGVGVQRYRVVDHPEWMGPTPPDAVDLIASHQDQVVEMPAGAELLLTSDYCPIAGFALGTRAWTVQAHPEFRADLADHLLAGRVEMIGAGRVATARASLARPADGARVAAWIAATLPD